MARAGSAILLVLLLSCPTTIAVAQGPPLAAGTRVRVVEREPGPTGIGVCRGALGCLANKDDYGVYCGGQDDTKVIVGVALGGIAGGNLGAVLFKTERWRAVELF